MICNNCKNEINDNSAFCPHCGMLFVVPAPNEGATVIPKQNLPVYNSESFRKKLEQANAQAAAETHNNTIIRKGNQIVNSSSDRKSYESEFDQLDEMYKKALQLERTQKIAEMRRAAEERAREADAIARKKAEEELRERMAEHERHSRAVAEELVKEKVISEDELEDTDEDVIVSPESETKDAASEETAVDISGNESSEDPETSEEKESETSDEEDYIFGDEEDASEETETTVEESETEPESTNAAEADAEEHESEESSEEVSEIESESETEVTETESEPEAEVTEESEPEAEATEDSEPEAVEETAGEDIEETVAEAEIEASSEEPTEEGSEITEEFEIESESTEAAEADTEKHESEEVSEADQDEAVLAEMLAVIEAEEKSAEMAAGAAGAEETEDFSDTFEAYERSEIPEETQVTESASDTESGEVPDDSSEIKADDEISEEEHTETPEEVLIRQKKAQEEAEAEYVEAILSEDKLNTESAAGEEGKRKGLRVPVLVASVLIVAAVSAAGYTAWNNTPARQTEMLRSAGDTAYAAKDYSAAEESYTKLLSYGTQSPDIYLHLADIYYNESDHEKAINVIKEALAAYPEDSDLAAAMDRLCPVVVITPNGGTYGEAVSVNLSVNGGNDIYYILTADGAAGTEIKYEAPITLDTNGTYKIDAYGVVGDGYKGDAVSATYTINIEPETVPETEAPQETEAQNDSGEFSFAAEYAEYPDTLVEIQTSDRQDMGDYSVFPAKVYHSHNGDKPEGDPKEVSIKISNSAWLHYIDYDYGSIPVKDAYVFLNYIGLINATTDENGIVTKFDFILGSQK